MKKILFSGFLFITLCASGTLSAQTSEPKYIEVTVTDTIVLVPDEILYSIRIKDQSPMEYPVYDDNTDNTDYLNDLKRKEEEAKFRMEASLKRLKEFLAKEKVNIKEAISTGTSNAFAYLDSDDSYTDYSVLCAFTSMKELSVLIAKIPKDIEHYGNIAGMRCTKTAAYESELLEKIIKRAKTQAEKIAQVSKVNLGSMIQYSDNVNEIAKSIEETIRSLMRESKKFREFQFENMVITKTARVRYSIQ